ncbi:MAG: hypothetical protein IJQ28_06085, partial [Clostridia bacterium]|nr:hypothetical protein [Clostridia bacterium]
MMKLKKLISLICTLCMVSTYAFIPSFGTNAVMAAASDVSQYFNSDKSGVGTTWSKGTVTDNGNSSWTVSGTVGSSDGWVEHRTEFGFELSIGEGVAQTVGHVGWTMSNPNSHEINISYRHSGGRAELAKWDMSAGTIKDTANNNFLAVVNPQSYQGDFFINFENGGYRLYFNNILFSEGTVQGNKFRNLILNVPTQ